MEKMEILEMQFYPEVLEKDFNYNEYEKISLSDLKDLGLNSTLIASSFQTFAAGKSGLYRVVVPSSTHLAGFVARDGFLSTALSDATNQIVGQATLTPLTCNPATLFMSIATASINIKLSNIERTQKEIIEDFDIEHETRLKGALAVLTELIKEYKEKHENVVYRQTASNKALDYMNLALEEMERYKIKLVASCNKKTVNLKGAAKYLRLYRASLYLHCYARLLKVLAWNDYDNENAIRKEIKEIEEQLYSYKQLYTICYNELESRLSNSLQTRISNLTKDTELLIKTTTQKVTRKKTAIEIPNKKIAVENKMKLLAEDDSFTSNIFNFVNTLNRMTDFCKETIEIHFDQKNIYVKNST